MRISRVKEPFKNLNGVPHKTISVRPRSNLSKKDAELTLDNVVAFPNPVENNKTQSNK